MGAKAEQADSRIRFAQVGGRGVETLLGAQVRPGSGVVVLQNGVGRKMKIGGTVGAESGHMAQELDGLQFAAELEFENVADGKIIGRRESQRLQRGVVQVGIGSREAANGETHGRRQSHSSGDANSWSAARRREDRSP